MNTPSTEIELVYLTDLNPGERFLLASGEDPEPFYVRSIGEGEPTRFVRDRDRNGILVTAERIVELNGGSYFVRAIGRDGKGGEA